MPEARDASDIKELLEDKYIKVDIYDNDYYAKESNTKFMEALTDYLASELDWPIKAANVKVYKVRPMLKCKNKECLTLYVEVNSHKAWTL